MQLSISTDHNLRLQDTWPPEMAETTTTARKMQKIRINMEWRRKLEQRMEERKLHREICEFEFEERR